MICWTFTKATAEEFKHKHPKATVYYSEGVADGGWNEVPDEPNECCQDPENLERQMIYGDAGDVCKVCGNWWYI